jgi:4-hydroxybenzoate polyprenyltransferase
VTDSALKTFASVTRLHIVCIAALGTFTFGWLFTGRYLWLLAGVCALDWFVVNLLNRVVDLPEDRANAIVGTDLVARRRQALLAIGFGTLGASLVATHLVAPALTPWRLGYHALGLTYNWRLLPGGRRIKQLYFWKNTASAAGFLITVMAYPLAQVGWAPTAMTWAAIGASAVFFFLFELSYEVAYDLRDAPGDAREGVRTYAVVHGPRVASRILHALALSSAVILAGGWVAHVVPWRVAVMAVAPILQVILVRRALARGITSADCVNLTWVGALLLLAYHGWVGAGLPGVSS